MPRTSSQRFTVELRREQWPEPAIQTETCSTREKARATARELLRGDPEARICDVRLHVRLVDQYARRRTTGGIRHLYAAPVREQQDRAQEVAS